MRTLKRIIAAILLLTLMLPVRAFALEQTVSSTELIDHAKQYDGQTVCYVGEVIGDVMLRGDHAWVNVSDGSSAIGVWLTAEKAARIKYVGSYDILGDTVEIVGVFHRACNEHGGDLDIHAQSLKVTQSGSKKEQQAEYAKAIAASVLFAAGIGIAVVILKKRI